MSAISPDVKRHCNILDLPFEIRAQIWRYAIPLLFHGHVECQRKNIFNHESDDPNACRAQDFLNHRAIITSLLLVNKQVYHEAKPYVSQEQTFIVCQWACLMDLVQSVPKEMVNEFTTIKCFKETRLGSNEVHPAHFNAIIQSHIRIQLEDAYSGRRYKVEFHCLPVSSGIGWFDDGQKLSQTLWLKARDAREHGIKTPY